jgi:hypothetical protein
VYASEVPCLDLKLMSQYRPSTRALQMVTITQPKKATLTKSTDPVSRLWILASIWCCRGGQRSVQVLLSMGTFTRALTTTSSESEIQNVEGSHGASHLIAGSTCQA